MLADQNGRLLQQIQLSSTSSNTWNETNLPLHDLPSGIYFLQLRSANQLRTERLVVVK
ncbi:MAG: T9SS type A sorting domain-containing protein [Saprospiraceae bacterium]|nr:T9SS type A sorting domain-containing protein [Saprospiraceae bacterium]